MMNNWINITKQKPQTDIILLFVVENMDNNSLIKAIGKVSQSLDDKDDNLCSLMYFSSNNDDIEIIERTFYESEGWTHIQQDPDDDEKDQQVKIIYWARLLELPDKIHKPKKMLVNHKSLDLDLD